MRAICIVVMCLVLTACAGTADRTVTTPAAGETLFILGIAPESYQIQISDGKVEYGLFKAAPAAFVKVNSTPTGGYVVWKGPSSEISAITRIIIKEKTTDLIGQHFFPCGDAPTMVFSGSAGKVVYLGNVRYRLDGKRLHIDYEEDLKAAQAFVDRRYPELKAEVTLGKYELLPTDEKCVRVVFVPIYSPRMHR
jgi:hypothetical protein